MVVPVVPVTPEERQELLPQQRQAALVPQLALLCRDLPKVHAAKSNSLLSINPAN